MKAKISPEAFFLDGAVDNNKAKQLVTGSLKTMMKHKTYTRTEQGRGYKFNVEGDQTPYIYEVGVETLLDYGDNT